MPTRREIFGHGFLGAGSLRMSWCLASELAMSDQKVKV
jgi:hypothetical protein